MGDTVSEAVEVFVMGGGIRSLPAVVIERDDDMVRLRVEGLSEGTAVFFQNDDPGPWLWGRVLEASGDGVMVQVLGHHRPDRREFARAWGPVHVRYQTISEEGYELAAKRWLERGDGVARRWVQPDLFMNFSGSGLRFDGAEAVQPGDRALVGVRVPGDDREHRLTAVVVAGSGEADATTALHFLQASEGAIMALVEFAERIQEQALDDLEGLDDLDY